MLNMEEWYEESVLEPKRKKKQDWERVSQEAKQRKLRNKASKRDVERELRIEDLGGKPIEIPYGVPLTKEQRRERLEIEWDIKYPNRKDKKETARLKRKRARSKIPTGSERTKKDFVLGILRTIKARSKRKGIPIDIIEKDILIPDVCPVFGIPLVWGDKLSDNTPSVDRMVPSLGYVKGNCNVISMKANRLKNNASLGDLKRLVEYMEGKI